MPYAGNIPVARAPLIERYVRRGTECIQGPQGELLASPPQGSQGNSAYDNWPTPADAKAWWPVRQHRPDKAYLAYPLDVAAKVYSLRPMADYPPHFVVIRVFLEPLVSDSGSDAGSDTSGERRRGGGPSDAITRTETNGANGFNSSTGRTGYAGSDNGTVNGYEYNRSRAVPAFKTLSRKVQSSATPTSSNFRPAPTEVITNFVGPPMASAATKARNMPSSSRSAATTLTGPRKPLIDEVKLGFKPVAAGAPTPARHRGSATASPAGRHPAASGAPAAYVKTGRLTKASATSMAHPSHTRAYAVRVAIACAA